MKQLLITLCLFFLSLPGNSFAQAHNDLNWYTDVRLAQEKSKASHKPIFALFTGSDWCVWCHKLENDVFAKPAFVKWAKEKVVLLMLDFPRHTQLSPELTQQNGSLQEAFHVQGYPTVWMFFITEVPETKKMNITPLGSLGYPSGAIPGKEEVQFLSEANKILATKNKKSK